jgi:hypothetical protein
MNQTLIFKFVTLTNLSLEVVWSSVPLVIADRSTAGQFSDTMNQIILITIEYNNINQQY